MNNLSIDSKIVPKIYFKYDMSNDIGDLYTLLKQCKKRDAILYKIFIKDMLMSKLDKDIVKIVKKDFLNIDRRHYSKDIKNRIVICQITNEKEIQNIYKYNFKKYIYTVFNLVNQNQPYLKHIINPDYDVYLKRFYTRYFAIDYSPLMKSKTQINRINKYGEILHQLFRLKRGLFNIISKDILNIIFKEIVKMEPNLGFIYVNCVKGNKLYNSIHKIETSVYSRELNYTYRYCDDDDGEGSNMYEVD